MPGLLRQPARAAGVATGSLAAALVVVLSAGALDLPARGDPGASSRDLARGGTASRVDTASSAEAAARQEHIPYDGRFTFTRVRYGSGGGSGRGWGRSAWAHDYPAADRNMQTMLNEFTAMRAATSGSNVLDLEDPRIFLHPVLYMSEPGYWRITEEGAANLRLHLLKGGFIMFDDFEARQWDNMALQVAQALPEGRWMEIDASHPIFSTFFRVEDIYVPHPLVSVTPRYMAIFEENDPSRRIMVLANHNSDLAEYWEYAASGYFPVDPTNDAFRLGINYLIYATTR